MARTARTGRTGPCATARQGKGEGEEDCPPDRPNHNRSPKCRVEGRAASACALSMLLGSPPLRTEGGSGPSGWAEMVWWARRGGGRRGEGAA
eukprot:5805710-Pyramimonas_sp.AAC.1